VLSSYQISYLSGVSLVTALVLGQREFPHDRHFLILYSTEIV